MYAPGGFKSPKRQLQSHASSSPLSQRHYDLEKRGSLDEDSDYDASSPISSAYSSRVVSGASAIMDREPMLPRRDFSPSPSRTPRKRAYDQSYRSNRPWRILCRCTPRWSSRLFGLMLGAVVVMFVYGLLHSSWRSQKEVAEGARRPPPPPPVWESFPFLKRYHGGIRKLVPASQNVPEYPNREEDTEIIVAVGEQAAVDRGEEALQKRAVEASERYAPYGDNIFRRPCFLDTNDTIRLPIPRIYNGVPQGQPDPVVSSHSVLGLRDDICFERFGRYGPYGLGYSRKYGGTGAAMEGDREGIEPIWETTGEIDYRGVSWYDAQKRCEEVNSGRFKPLPVKGSSAHFAEPLGIGHSSKSKRQKFKDPIGDSRPINIDGAAGAALLPRTVVLIRTWADFEYDDEDLLYLRSLIAELSLNSGAEYTVHFLIHVRDENLQIWADTEVYARVLAESLPAEFAGMGTLWSEPQMRLVYPGLAESNFRDLPVYGVYRSFWMPAMHFSHLHPEYDYYWNVEMDARYIGHWYELFDKASSWAKKQPRKGLWERNGRFYLPSEHGTWDEYSHMVRVQTEHGTASKSNIWAGLANNPDVPEHLREEAAGSSSTKVEQAVWGPEPVLDNELNTLDPITPSTTMAADKNTWGVDEEADLITFFPLFDPHGTNWVLAEDLTGYNRTRALPPRRAAINTFGRLSARLLRQMYHDTLHQHRTMSAEMFPATTCLHHGMKAVYAPHPLYIDRRWPTSYLASVLNNGRNGASGGARTSVFSEERQHNFLGQTWYYHAGFAPNLWRRWLGYKVDNDGGEQEELAGEGRICMRSVLLHPVKGVNMIIEPET